MEGKNPQAVMLAETRQLKSKWEKTGLLEGLKEREQHSMAVLLENQAKQLLDEATQTGTSTGSEEWSGVALPLVRRIFGEIAAKEFVSVQPMNLPSGLVFFLDFQYGTAKNPFTLGGSMYGNRNASDPNTPFSTTAAAGGLYGAGRFTYSTNQFSASLTSGSAAATTAVFSQANWSDVNYDSDFSASAAANTLWKVSVTASLLSNADLDGARGFLVSASANQKDVYNYAQFTAVSGTTITFIVSGSALPTGPVVALYNKKTADNARGDFEDGATYAIPNAASASAISIPEINISMQSQAITAKTKKLKAVWTPEFAQDLNAYQNLDAEAELTNIMSEYISLEIDLEILDMLIENVPSINTEYWSAVNNQSITAPNLTFTNLGFYNSQGQWFQTLGTKMQKLSNKIHQLTLRGGANFLVCSPTVATVIESIPGFASNSDGSADKMEYAFGVQKAGQLNSRYTIYKNPYMTENTILMGFRGSQFLEAGAVFAPYIPLIMTPLIYDPNTFTPRKGLLTRYAKKMLRPEFYGKIYVSGLNSL